MCDIAAGGSHSLFSSALEAEKGGCWVEQGNFGMKVKTAARVLEVWASGFGQYGQLGDRAYIHLAPAKVVKELRVLTYPEVRLPCVQVACGENHSAAVVLEPCVCVSVGSTSGDVPKGEKKATKESKKESMNLKERPPGRDAIITYKPQVYVWGHNLGAQCGTGKSGNLAKPTVPVGIEGGRVEKVVCGYDYTGFVMREKGEGK